VSSRVAFAAIFRGVARNTTRLPGSPSNRLRQPHRARGRSFAREGGCARNIPCHAVRPGITRATPIVKSTPPGSRLSPPAARPAPSALPRPFPRPDPSPQLPSSVTSLCRNTEWSSHVSFITDEYCRTWQDQDLLSSAVKISPVHPLNAKTRIIAGCLLHMVALCGRGPVALSRLKMEDS
jgi:hypothetical protein